MSANTIEGPKVTSRPKFPSRYQDSMHVHFRNSIGDFLRPGMKILDVGSGRKPAISPDHRPPSCRYEGLDISRAELEAAPEGSYDSIWVQDLCEGREDLHNQFDLIVSWQVLEHVKPSATAIANIRDYLVPGGAFIGALSGSWALFSVANRIIPHRLGVFAMKHLLSRDPESVFPAHYDRCHYSALMEMLDEWTLAEVQSFYTGAVYLNFSPLLQKAYLAWENPLSRRRWTNLATHYLIVATK